MLNTKLFKLLRRMSPEEMGRLRNYLSQRHKRSTQISRLFVYIDKYHPNFVGNKDKLTPEKVYTQVFKKSIYNKGQMQELTSRLLKEIQFFLITVEVEENDILYDVLLNRAFKKRGMDDLFKLHNKSAQKKILKNTILEQSHYDALFELSHEATFHRDTKTLSTDYYEQLIETERHLDAAYVLDKLKIICERITLRGFVQTSESKSLLEVDYQSVVKKISSSFLLNLYLKVTELYEKNDPEIYHELKQQITDSNHTISTENRYTLVRFLINYCSKKYKENTLLYTRELFNLYQFSEQNKLLIEDKYISEVDYVNVVKIAVAVKEFKYAKRLIRYADDLKPEYRKNGHALASAILHFGKKEYDEVKISLREIKWWDMNYKLTARDLMLRTHYESNDYKSLNNLMKTSLKNIEEDADMSEAKKEVNINFVNFINQLMKHKMESTSPSEALSGQLHEHPIVYIEWCQEKLLELQGEAVSLLE